jgi:hypothetical protein
VKFVETYGMIPITHPDLPDLDDALTPDVQRNRITDVVLFLSEAKSVVEHWVADVEDEHFEPAWAWRYRDGFLPDQILWGDFGGVMNRGLEAWPNRIEFPGLYNTMPEYVVFGPLPLGLFSACCLQLRNLMLDPVDLRRCENETCRRPFKRQRGGAKAGQNRTKGVRYCTPECATTQAQRVRRRNQRGK